MACGGCSGACTRILNKVEGVNGVECDLEKQTVTVDAADGVDPQALLAKLQGAAPAPSQHSLSFSRAAFRRRLGREGEQEGRAGVET